MALQRIVLHSKLDPKYSTGRGGRQRTYKQCIKDALDNFKVTMAQCMDMEQQDWDLRIEGIGLETAVQQWTARPKAFKPIDKEWRTSGGRQPGRKATVKQVEETDGADSGDTESDEERSDGDSDVESAAEDELAQSPDSQEEKEARADKENATPWDREMLVVAGQEEGEAIRQRGSGCRYHHNRPEVHRRAQSSVAEQVGSLEDGTTTVRRGSKSGHTAVTGAEPPYRGRK